MFISSEKQLGSPKTSLTPSFHQNLLKPAAQKPFCLQLQPPTTTLALPKTKMDTQNVGLEKVTPFKHGNFWYLC